MPTDIKKLLRTALDQVEQEEEHERLEARFRALEERRPEIRLGDIVDALGRASDDELDALEGTVLGGLVRAAREEGEGGNGGTDDGGDGGGPTPKPKRKRPGRKAGQAYDWWVDDDGQVYNLDVARVYSGEDEDDEVEVPEPKPKEDDE